MSRENILKAAKTLFEEKGFRGTSVRQLAKEAGVNVAMINYYFGSKDKLLEALVAEKAEYNLLHLSDIYGNKDIDMREKVFQVIDFYVDRTFAMRHYHHMLHREVATCKNEELKKSIANIIRRNHDVMRSFLKEGIDKGIFRPVDLDFMICTIYGTINMCSSDMYIFELKAAPLMPEDDGKAYCDGLKSHLKNIFQKFLFKEPIELTK